MQQQRYYWIRWLGGVTANKALDSRSKRLWVRLSVESLSSGYCQDGWLSAER